MEFELIDWGYEVNYSSPNEPSSPGRNLCSVLKLSQPYLPISRLSTRRAQGRASWYSPTH